MGKTLAFICLTIACATIGVSARAVQYRFQTKLDHMNPNGDDSTTFNMRYVVDDQYFYAKGSHYRPILFYAGNYGDVWDFYHNSGFITNTLARELSALVVFGEHRYFGQSFPIADQEKALQPPMNQHLTIENTMMDYVELIKHVRQKYDAENNAVIVFGGSYGGMLAAWLRIQYPSVFQGALAASAPILQFKGWDETGFYDVLTNDFATVYEDKRCSLGIKQGFQILSDLKTRTGDWEELSTLMNTCNKVENTTMIENLIEHYESGFAYMAMTDYPIPASFLSPMPAWPVNVSCEAFKDIAPPSGEIKKDPANGLSDDEKKYLGALNDAADVYFNDKQEGKCIDTSDTEGTGSLDARGWYVLACNQMAMPISSGNNSMFLEKAFDYDNYTKECQDKWGLTPDYDWAFRTFGGMQETLDFKQLSNIIFSNGNLDPWSAGGVSQFINSQLPVYLIRGGASNLDLRLPTEEDQGTDVEWVRNQELTLIERWCDEYGVKYPHPLSPEPEVDMIQN